MKNFCFIIALLFTISSNAIGQKVSLVNPSLDKANKYYDAGLYKEAIAEYSKTIYIEPTFMQAYNNRGLAKLELSDYNGALSDFNKVISKEPKNGEAYRNRATLKIRKQDYAGALADYDKAVALGANDADAFFNRGVAKVALNKS